MYLTKTVFTLFFIISFGQSFLTAQTPCSGGMAGIYPCSGVDLMAHLTTAAMSPNASAPNGNDIWGWTSPNTGKEYAIVGLTDGTAFVDVSNAASPIILGHLANAVSGTNLWRDIKVINNYAYIGSEASGHGLQIFNLAELDNAITGLPKTFTATSIPIGGAGNSHNIVSFPEQNLVATVGGGAYGGGLNFYDVSSSASPTAVGGYADVTNSYSHDAICVIYRGADDQYIGKQICFGFNEDIIVAVDMTDISNPIPLGNTTYSGVAYIHQGWISDDHNYIYLNDELDGNSSTPTRTHIINITDLEDMFREATKDGGSVAIDHNLYIKGNYIYQANYRAGLRILDITNRLAPTEDAFFDVYPTDDLRAFNGAWSVYPYFKSGTIIVSSIEGGLFVLQPTAALSHYVMENSSDGIQTVAQGTNATFTVDLTAYYGFGSNVNLSLSGVPGGSSSSFPAVVSANGSATITISNTAAAAIGKYQLILTGNSGLASEQSIALGLVINAILPVELVDFSATAKQNSIVLNWQTAAELQNKGFEIQRSMENTPNQFEPIDFIAGQGNSDLTHNYFYEDTNVQTGVVYYYRLRQVDEDGTEQFSEIRSAKIDGFEQLVEVFPNPVTDFLNVKFTAFGFPVKNIEMNIVNVNGQVIDSQKLDISGGEMNYELDTQGLSEGIYLLNFVIDGKEFRKRFVKL